MSKGYIVAKLNYEGDLNPEMSLIIIGNRLIIPEDTLGTLAGFIGALVDFSTEFHRGSDTFFGGQDLAVCINILIVEEDETTDESLIDKAYDVLSNPDFSAARCSLKYDFEARQYRAFNAVRIGQEPIEYRDFDEPPYKIVKHFIDLETPHMGQIIATKFKPVET